jgi:entericidin B
MPSSTAVDTLFFEEKTMMKKLIGSTLLVLFSVGLAASVSGCNTVAGIGEDVEHGGQKLERAADRSK